MFYNVFYLFNGMGGPYYISVLFYNNMKILNNNMTAII